MEFRFRLRHQVQGTVWQPGVADNFPVLLTAAFIQSRLEEVVSSRFLQMLTVQSNAIDRVPR